MNFYDATDIATAILPKRLVQTLVRFAVLVLAVLLWSPLLSTRDVGTWLHTQATQKVQTDLAPLVDHLQETLLHPTTRPDRAADASEPNGGG